MVLKTVLVNIFKEAVGSTLHIDLTSNIHVMGIVWSHSRLSVRFDTDFSADSVLKSASDLMITPFVPLLY